MPAHLPMLPEWTNNVPICQERCPYHDGKRCELLGHRPDRICEPTVARMGAYLAARLSSMERYFRDPEET